MFIGELWGIASTVGMGWLALGVHDSITSLMV